MGKLIGIYVFAIVLLGLFNSINSISANDELPTPINSESVEFDKEEPGENTDFDPPEDIPKDLTYPKLGSLLSNLVQNIGIPGAQSVSEAAPISLGSLVAVTVRTSENNLSTRAFAQSVGSFIANWDTNYFEAYVPVSILSLLSERPEVTKVSPLIGAHTSNEATTSEGAKIHRSSLWNDFAYTGNSIKVGIIDAGFAGYESLMGSELPISVSARCYYLVGYYTTDLDYCDAGGEDHGTAVAEALVDIAPNVELYIGNPISSGDVQTTVNWMVEEGVEVINVSMDYSWKGPGDGTSPYSESILNSLDYAVENGVVWVNSSGNAAESHWFGVPSDADQDGYFTFNSNETNELSLNSGQKVTIQLRWEDPWSYAGTDLDLKIWDLDLFNTVVDSSTDLQNGTVGQDPYEFLSFTAPWSGNFQITVFHDSGPVPDWLQLKVWGSDISQYVKPYSVGNPSESANTGMLAVGAVNWATPTEIESFSSRGPTTDGRIKPDIVGVDRGNSVTMGINGFSGTSQSSPHVAGLAALVKQRFPSYTPQQVVSYLKTNAYGISTVPNNTWGYGLAKLPLFAPSSPQDINATNNLEKATVSWIAPEKNGGREIIAYKITSDPASTEKTINGFPASPYALTDISTTDNKAYSLTLYENKILVGGFSYNGTNDDFAITRYNSDGTLDTTFGSSGTAITSFGTGTASIQGLTTTADGKTIAAGYVYNGTTYDVAIAQYTTDGSIDSTFGNAGTIIVDMFSSTDVAKDVISLDNGNVLVAGYTQNGFDYEGALIMFDSNGELDLEFGSSGKSLTSVSCGDYQIKSIALQDDGKILAVGIIDCGNSDFVLARYNPNGTLDTTFGNGGATLMDLDGKDDVLNSVSIQQDGKIVAAGYTFNGSRNDFVILRINTSGSIDTTFGDQGLHILDIGNGNNAFEDIFILSDDSIIAVGHTSNENDLDGLIVKYDSNGNLDPMFADSCIYIQDYTYGNEKLYGVSQTPSGDFVVAGYGYNEFNYDAMIGRLDIDGNSTSLITTIPNLQKGTSYTFKVSAINSIGESQSTASDPIRITGDNLIAWPHTDVITEKDTPTTFTLSASLDGTNTATWVIEDVIGGTLELLPTTADSTILTSGITAKIFIDAIYTPNPGFEGSGQVTYHINDGISVSPSTSFEIIVGNSTPSTVLVSAPGLTLPIASLLAVIMLAILTIRYGWNQKTSN